MELLFIPVSLTLGAVLIFFGINGLPAGLQLSRSLPAFGPLPRNVAQPPPLPPLPPRLSRAPARRDMAQSDLFLAELMTEMINIRAELAELREKVDAAQSVRRPAVVRPRRIVRAS